MASQPDFIRAAGLAPGLAYEFLLIEAAGKAKARVLGLAYGGGKMNLPGWRHPVVVDLKGLEIPPAVPLLTNHENRTGSRIGVVRAKVEGNALVMEGEVLSTSNVARGVVEQARAGGDWQLSIGAEVKEAELVTGERTVNGQAHKGPFYHVQKSVLREISVLPVGADGSTRLKIAASFHLSGGGKQMEFEKWLEAKGFKIEDLTDAQKENLKAMWEAEKAAAKKEKDADPPKDEGKTVAAGGRQDSPGEGDDDPAKRVQAEIRAAAALEAKRIAGVQKLCAAYEGKVKPDELNALRAKAIEEEWDERDTELALLRAERPKPPAIQAPQDETGPRVLEAALCLGNGLGEEAVVKAYGEKAVETVRRRYGGPIGARQFVLEAAWANGFTDRYIHTGNLREALRAAFSTQSASGILSNVANKVLLDAYMHVESAWQDIAAITPVNDFKTITHYRLTGDMQYEEVGPDGELHHAATNEESYTNQAKTYGKMFVVTRTDIINDDLGAFNDLRKMLGRGAALKINDIFWTEFMDNSSFFTAARGNYKSGTSTAFDAAGDGLSLAVQLFRDQTDADSKPLGLKPKIIAAPTALETKVLKVLNSTSLKGDTDEGMTNPHAGQYKPVISAYLGNSSYTGYSTKAWYLVGDPDDMAVIEVVFLGGKRTPTVESADADFDTLGIQVRGYHDFGVSKAEYRAGVKMKGEA